MRVAQTNVQLYNQLRERGDSLEDLVTVHRGYELLTTLYPGYFQADGKPFVAHGVGVASVLAELGQPADTVTAGLLHNVYGNADFGDGRGPGWTPVRHRIVSEAIGDRTERILRRFVDFRVTPETIDGLMAGLPESDETDRAVLLIDLADIVEKHADLGVLYYGKSDWIDMHDQMGSKLVEMANALGQPRLGEMLSSAVAEAAAAAGEVPPELRPSDGRRYSVLMVPRSCRRRRPSARERVRQVRVGVQALRGRVRARTRG